MWPMWDISSPGSVTREALTHSVTSSKHEYRTLTLSIFDGENVQ